MRYEDTRSRQRHLVSRDAPFLARQGPGSQHLWLSLCRLVHPGAWIDATGGRFLFPSQHDLRAVHLPRRGWHERCNDLGNDGDLGCMGPRVRLSEGSTGDTCWTVCTAARKDRRG